MKTFTLFLIVWCLAIPGIVQSQEISVIPYPESIALRGGIFVFKKGAIGYTDTSFVHEAAYLKEKLSGFSLNIRKRRPKKAMIVLKYRPEMPNDEAYHLQIASKRIIISGRSRKGIFYGIQTLLQLRNNEGDTLKCLEIMDMPRYAWRGYMLDEARHFFGKRKVMELLDWMAYYKLNKFHWHLTDEPGWRLEISQYPRLSTIGGRGNWSNPDAEVRYYTRQDILEILDYAARRHIEVIPEIDMPGHATAANVAYPEYSGGGTPEHPDFTFNVGKEEVYTFLGNVLREVAGLFPSPYIHIGGDEVAYGIKAWETDSSIQAMMKREGLSTVKEAERYFMHRMVDTVRSLGKVLVGWDELLDLNVPVDSTLIMWWRHDRVNQLRKSLAGGYTTIMCPRRPLYFDFTQHKSHKWGRVWNGFCPLEDVYAFPDKGMAAWQLPAGQLSLITGIQANLWTERVQNTDRLDFMTFPRICALAESAWTVPGQKDYQSFLKRMEDAYRDFDKAGIYYFDVRNAEAHPEPAGAQRKERNVPMDFRD